MPKFFVWRTIRHLGQRNVKSYRAGLSSIECRFNEWTNDLLGRFEATSVDEAVDIGCASVAELGFTEPTRFDVICDRIVALGYILCLPEDGPVLREQYPEQPRNEWARLIMKPICDSEGNLFIFYVGHDEHGLLLDWDHGNPDDLFNPNFRVVFRLCKRSLVA